MVNLTPVGRHIPLRNEPIEGGVIRNVSSLTDWWLEDSAAVSLKGEE